MRKRLMVLLVVAAMGVAALAGPAAAGEVKGPPGEGGAQGGATPIAGFWIGDGAASICSFSGLNDVIEEFEPTQTQSYGTFLVLFMKTFDLNAQDAKAALGDAPAQACNPNNAPWGNPKK
ncbi:MAG: hypothetical protein M3092_09380 [Actinomycetia bacterium]|nr:hypothetical protein [Actinomycetes bacterium]